MTVGMQGAEQVAPGDKLIAAQITSDAGFLLAQGALGPHGESRCERTLAARRVGWSHVRRALHGAQPRAQIHC